ncbi:ankyrin-repeat protein, putative [Plasmodium vinckei vinckei]|uniref:Ankyrin-repeat protein, putative n=1 Tax=Plasmodium vinckei vinckei TaxID=54757 RepID=A0A449BQL2_PLAVN|nr:ankyrin-repeat protein, putative [Plasmodium vinckei vinckei]VEV55678.1 ankyrin-repeat protein, putative [Plasmodium vinckei vinckei]
MISVTLTNGYVYDKLSDLGLCVFTGNMKRLKKLLKKTGINTKFTNDSSLLHICSHNDNPNMFYFLLSKGCDYTHINGNGDTCLHMIVLNNNISCLEILCRYDIKDIIDIKNRDGDTALHISIKNGFYECFFLLIKKGADTEIKDYFDMDSYELVDLYEKKEKLYDCYSSTYANMFNLLASMRRSK